uniref:Integrase catalytic domain-containing protein n=1 Tax=Angiostrongylus cantonensis TaxID=6313 RepID=A0A0K0DDR4_ANGCA
MSVLYRYYSSYIKQVKKKSAVKRKELKKINPDLALQIYYYEELNRRVDGQNRPIVNRFRDGGGRLMHREICLDLARLIEHDNERSNTIWGSDFLLDIAHRTLFSQGPGCFAWMSANKRDVRTLNIRYYDEKLKAIPEAYILGIFTPLITTVISGTMCELQYPIA